MPHRDTILFWLGGIFTETIDELTLKVLLDTKQVQENYELLMKLNTSAEELYLGKISGNDYYQRALKITHSSSRIGELEQMLAYKGILNQYVMRLVEEIPSKYTLWLISDYPRKWFERLSILDKIQAHFPRERTIFPSDGNFTKADPDLFQYLISRVNRSQSECILIDSVSTRAVEAVRYGLSSIIYVYPEQLMHQFELRGILKVDKEVLHPRGSKRVHQ